MTPQAEDTPPWFPLETERLRLRPFRPEDRDDVHAYGSDPMVSRYMVWGPNSEADTDVFLGKAIEAQSRWPRHDVSLAMELKATGQMIGSIRLWVVDAEQRTAEIGYCLARPQWRRGLTSEAALAMMTAGFDILGLHRIVATCDRRNRGSWRVMRKLGMRREGLLRRERMVKGAWRDTYLYALTEEDWAARI
ncbi:MAG TPA: GNAT family N-acetyltransferase [Phenylobacterium sp.]|nr:GNAT family N-acetyltransferase [Phenylobacterium sp.]